MKTKPLNNNCLIEVMRPDDGVSRTDDNESMQYGKLVDYSISRYHITASSFGLIDEKTVDHFGDKIGSIVRWEQYAEGGQTFEEDGKTYALIPYWRLISIEETN